MLKKTIKFTDYNGNDREEDFYFHLNQAELVELELGTKGGLAETIEVIANTQSTPELIEIFKKIILKAYGERVGDSRVFKKLNEDGKPLYINFMQTEAYSVLFMELATDSKAAAEFVNGIVPRDLAEKAAAAQIEQKTES